MLKNVGSQNIGAQMAERSDGSNFTGAVTVYVTGDSGTQTLGATGSGACTHEGRGYHSYMPSQAETNYSHVSFTFEGTGAVTVTVQVYPQPANADVNVVKVNGTTQTARDLGFGIPAAQPGATNGLLIAGVNTTLTITGALTIGDGVIINTATTGRHGIQITGNGNGHGAALVGGTTGGNGLNCFGGTSGATSGAYFRGGASGAGLSLLVASGSGPGLSCTGLTSGAGMAIQGGTGGAGVTVTSGNSAVGVSITGGTKGIYLFGDTAAHLEADGLNLPALYLQHTTTTGDGIEITTTDGHGIDLTPIAGSGKVGIKGTPISDWEDGGRLDLLLDQVIAAVVTAAAEPTQGAPPVSASRMLKIDWLYKFLRNKSDQSATLQQVYADDGTTIDHKRSIAEAGGTVTLGEVAAGP